MKKVLFIGTMSYDFKKLDILHLRKKFELLSKGIKPYVLAKGRPFQKKIWNCEFYLLPKKLFWIFSLPIAFYLCLKKKIDTIVAQSPLLDGFFGAILKKILKKELIIEVHGNWIAGYFLFKKKRFENLQRKLIGFLAKISLKSCDKIRAVSGATKQQALNISGVKPCFVFPAFDAIDYFLKETNPRFENFILYVGSLIERKGVKYLISAFSKIEKEFPNLRLVIIGDGPEKENLKNQVKEMKLEDKVEFKGKLSLMEVKNVMKNCYCFVLPSLSEGLGLVLMEAMALGKPVIGSNVEGIPDLIKDGENGFLFEPKNIEELVEKLKILLRDKNLAIEMGERGREFAKENFLNEKFIENYIKMISF